MNKKYQYILFDWDGCLVDTLPIWFQGMKEGLKYFNISASDDIVKRGFQGWDIFTEIGVSSMEVFTSKVYDCVNRNLYNVNFNDGVLDTLSLLKQQGVKLAIVTSTEREKVNTVLERYSMTNIFECIVGRNDVKKHKPDAEGVNKALDIMNGDKCNTIIIGDSEVDIKAGQNAGITTIWFSSESNRKYHSYMADINPAPDFVVSNFSDIMNLN